MRDKRSETRYEFKLNFKEITLFIVGSVGVISLFFIIGIWIGKSLNEVPNELLTKEYVPLGDGLPKETVVDISKDDDDPDYDFEETLRNGKTIPLTDDKIKVMDKDEAKTDKANKIKSEIDNFSVNKSENKEKAAAKPKPKEEAKPEPKPKPEQVATSRPAPKEEPKKGRYTVQMASFQSDKAALKLKMKLEKLGYDAYFVAMNIKDKGVWYRVRVGNFTTKDSAKKMINSLEKKIKLKGMIVRDSRN